MLYLNDETLQVFQLYMLSFTFNTRCKIFVQPFQNVQNTIDDTRPTSPCRFRFVCAYFTYIFSIVYLLSQKVKKNEANILKKYRTVYRCKCILSSSFKKVFRSMLSAVFFCLCFCVAFHCVCIKALESYENELQQLLAGFTFINIILQQ